MLSITNMLHIFADDNMQNCNIDIIKISIRYLGKMSSNIMSSYNFIYMPYEELYVI